jgi:hypothetical protein
MFQHAPPGYRFRRFSGLADLRVSRPDRLLYDSRPTFVKDGANVDVRAVHSMCRARRGYAVGVATGDAAGMGTALASV